MAPRRLLRPMALDNRPKMNWQVVASKVAISRKSQRRCCAARPDRSTRYPVTRRGNAMHASRPCAGLQASHGVIINTQRKAAADTMPTDSRFDSHPRVQLLAGPTPIQRLHRVEATLAPALSGARMFVKRDDATNLGGGGNKLRKLEFLFGEAVEQGADTIIATGPRQSNSARLAAAAAASLGLSCELGLRPLAADDDLDYRSSGNTLLDSLFGATVRVLPDAAAVGAFVAERKAALEAEGRVGYVLPPGASSPRASLGYADCALEIADQEQAMGLQFDRVVVANGSAGTQAGLVAGFTLLRRRAIVHGFSVLADKLASHANTLAMARECTALL